MRRRVGDRYKSAILFFSMAVAQVPSEASPRCLAYARRQRSGCLAPNLRPNHGRLPRTSRAATGDAAVRAAPPQWVAAPLGEAPLLQGQPMRRRRSIRQTSLALPAVGLVLADFHEHWRGSGRELNVETVIADVGARPFCGNALDARKAAPMQYGRTARSVIGVARTILTPGAGRSLPVIDPLFARPGLEEAPNRRLLCVQNRSWRAWRMLQRTVEPCLAPPRRRSFVRLVHIRSGTGVRDVHWLDRWVPSRE